MMITQNHILTIPISLFDKVTLFGKMNYVKDICVETIFFRNKFILLSTVFNVTDNSKLSRGFFDFSVFEEAEGCKFCLLHETKLNLKDLITQYTLLCGETFLISFCSQKIIFNKVDSLLNVTRLFDSNYVSDYLVSPIKWDKL